MTNDNEKNASHYFVVKYLEQIGLENVATEEMVAGSEAFVEMEGYYIGGSAINISGLFNQYEDEI